MKWSTGVLFALAATVYLLYGALIVRVARARFDPHAIARTEGTDSDRRALAAVKITACLAWPVVIVIAMALVAVDAVAAVARALSKDAP